MRCTDKCPKSILKKNFLENAKKFHPDVSDCNPLVYEQYRKAYEILSDPVQKVKYDSLNKDANEKFNKTWDLTYKSEHSFEVVNIKNRKATKNFLVELYYKYKKSIYANKLAELDRQINIDYSVGRNRLHFVLDNSGSMAKVIDDFDTSEHKIMYSPDPNQLHTIFELCKQNLIKTVKLVGSQFLISFSIFSDDIENIYIDIDGRNSRHIEKYSKKLRCDGNYTALYSTIYKLLKQSNNVKNTTFIIFTDGENNVSSVLSEHVRELIKELKEVKIIIMTYKLNIDVNKKLNDMIKHAKYGKILNIGDDLQLFDGHENNCKSIDEAFHKAQNQIILISKNMHKDDIDIRKEFDFILP